MPELTMGSLFDGIGGFPLAAVRNGITPVWASEIEPFPIEVTKHTSQTWFMSGISQSSKVRNCRPWTSSAGAVRVRTARLRPGHALVCRVRGPDCFLSKYGLQRS